MFIRSVLRAFTHNALVVVQSDISDWVFRFLSWEYARKNTILWGLCTVSKWQDEAFWERQGNNVDIASNDDIFQRFWSLVKTISKTFLWWFGEKCIKFIWNIMILKISNEIYQSEEQFCKVHPKSVLYRWSLWSYLNDFPSINLFLTCICCLLHTSYMLSENTRNVTPPPRGLLLNVFGVSSSHFKFNRYVFMHMWLFGQHNRLGHPRHQQVHA